MFAKVTLENFFSFGKATEVTLNSNVNILLGINGSGKSNFLRAIQLLAKSFNQDNGFSELLVNTWGGLEEVANFSQQKKDFFRLTFEFDCEQIKRILGNEGYDFRDSNPSYELSVHRAGNTAFFLEERVFFVNPDKQQLNETLELLNIKNGIGQILTRTGDTEQYIRYPDPDSKLQLKYKLDEPILKQFSDPYQHHPLVTLRRCIEELAVYDYFDTTQGSVIRQPRASGTEDHLLPNGQNLTYLLNFLKNNHALAFERIETLVTDVNPQFKDIGFDHLRDKMYLVLRERQLDRAVSVGHISDGTLRFLLLLAIFYNPKRGAIVGIDEPEIGLHPDMIATIAKAIKAAGNQGSQMFIATHSPLLLNSFEIGDVLVFEKNQENQTTVSFKAEEDFESLDDQPLLGQLWLRGKIGGKRW